MSQHLVTALSTFNTRPKKPSPTREWMVGHHQNNRYITDGSVMVEISIPDAVALLPIEFQHAFSKTVESTHVVENLSTGVYMTLKGSIRTLQPFPCCKNIIPVKTRPMEYTRVTLNTKLSVVRVIRNPETKEPTAINEEYIANLLWLGGYSRSKRNDDFRILQAEGNNESPCIIEPVNECGIRFLIMPAQCRELLAELKNSF